MFISTTHLPQILAPADYYSAEQHDRELSQIFGRSWHFVGTLADLPNTGDFITLDLLGRPLLVYRTSDGIRVFLNVCAHRFSMLTSKPCGHMGTLRCQYHGWEYDEAGQTRKIPDARSFKPLRDGQLGLTEVRSSLCGQLIFVTFSSDAPELSLALGEPFERLSEYVSASRRQILRRVIDVPVNWKVLIENTLESYHIECVHPKTFRRSPPAESCTHVMDEGGSLFKTSEPPASWAQRSLDSVIYGLMGADREIGYEHYIRYPNLMFGKAGIFSWIETITPLSPTSCRVVLTMFGHPGRNRNPLSRFTWRVFAFFGKRFTVQALDEDLAIIQDVQRGLRSATQTNSGGLISVREERLFHFQEYIRRMTPLTQCESVSDSSSR